MKKQTKDDILLDIKNDVVKTIETLRTKKYSELHDGVYDEKDLYSNLETFKGLKEILNKLNILDDMINEKGD